MGQVVGKISNIKRVNLAAIQTGGSLARHHQENEDDFSRNVLANLISSTIDINKLFKRR